MSRLFEDAYQERYTASTVLSTIGGESSAASTSASTRHLAMKASISDTTAAPGERLSLSASKYS